MKNTPDGEIAEALQGIRTRLNTLASINAEHMLVPGGPQERSHQMVEEAYTALGLLVWPVETHCMLLVHLLKC